jgi:hypothetical protein
MTVVHSIPEPANDTTAIRTRTPGAWSGVLFLLAAGITVAFLYLSREVDNLQTQVLQWVEAQTDASLRMGSARVSGFRSVRFEEVTLSYETDRGIRVESIAPNVVATVNPFAWLENANFVSRLEIVDAVVRVDASSQTPSEHDDKSISEEWLNHLPGNVSLERCTLVVDGVREGAAIEISDISGAIVRGQKSESLEATISGNYDREPGKSIGARIQYSALDDFECEFQIGALTAGDINGFLPEEHHFAESGRVSPSITIDALPDETFTIVLESEFQDITVRNQPAFMGAMAGNIAAYAHYDQATQVFSIRTATLDSDALNAKLSGQLLFADETHGIDLQLEATELPLQAALEHYLPDSFQEYGEMNIAFEQPEQFTVSITGTTDAFQIAATGRAPGATVSFKPNDDQYPEGHLELTGIEAGWDSETESPVLTASIRDGSIRHDESGIEANRLSGSIDIANNTIRLDPLNADIFDEPFVARASYSIEDETGNATVSGTLAEVERTALATAIKYTDLAGALSINATAILAAGAVTAEGEIEATNTNIDYNWWFSKPAGIGMRVDAKVAMEPDKSIVLTAKGDVAGSAITSRVDWERRGEKWQFTSSVSTAESIDVVSTGKCLRLPYTITGGVARNARHEWTLVESEGILWESTAEAEVDRIELLPETGIAPMVIKDAKIVSTFTKGDNSTGDLTLTATHATMPPFGEAWFRPLREDEVLLERFPIIPRDWRYTLHAAEVVAPPWSGTDFEGIATSDMDRVMLESYRANVDGGWVQGAFTSFRKENRYATELKWEDVPSRYFLEHLQLPIVLSGPINGQVAYGMDRDDPSTMGGSGDFTIRDGQFSADFIINLLEHQMEGEMNTLPPSLKFGRLHADVVFERDVVKTPIVELDAEGLTVRGVGEYVNDGDMDYTLNVSISPDTAEQIPALRDSLNLQGYRLAQKTIDLPFHVTGPTSAPISELTDAPPARVTLVTGALEVTKEAINVLDAPRKILVDLLKTAGGVVSARKSGAGNSP